MPIYVSRGNFPPRYEVPKFLARGGHLCMAVLTITAHSCTSSYSITVVPIGCTRQARARRACMPAARAARPVRLYIQLASGACLAEVRVSSVVDVHDAPRKC